MLSECTLQNSLGVGDEVQLELHHTLPGGSAVPRFSNSLLSTFDGQEHCPGAASCPPGMTAAAMTAAELSMWQPVFASTWEQGVPWRVRCAQSAPSGVEREGRRSGERLEEQGLSCYDWPDWFRGQGRLRSAPVLP